ncbi:MAG: prepilin-type N-terminal cleavage/methylation domain-containing protein [Rhodanobacteraceae bacterium]
MSTLPTTSQPCRMRGFSLLEMAVVLVIIGIIGAMFWLLLPRLQTASSPEPAPVVELRSAKDALVGFALAHSRLPCPDTNGNGLENCGGTENVGRLPQITLGQLYPHIIRYGVNRLATTDLTTLTDRYIPNIPGAAPAVEPLNGLDMCIALRDAQASTLVGLSVGSHSVPTAFALASSGAGDASGDGNLFDGLNSGTGFAAPGSPITAGYDDYTEAAGFGELAMRMGCLVRLAEVNGAARSAMAARDLYDLAAFYKDFRHFANVGTRTLDIQMAQFSVVLAGVDEALAAAQLALSIAGAAESAGAAAFDIGLATVGLADATANLALAIIGLQDAQAAKVTAQQQDDAATVTKAQYAAWAEAARVRARAEDALGLIK